MLERLGAFGRAVVANPHYKLLSVLLALSAWWYVQASEVSTDRHRVALQWVLPADLVTTEPLPPSVVVTLEGSRSVLRRVPDDGKLSMTVDIGDISQDTGTASVELSSYTIDGLPPGASVAAVNPATVPFTLDEEDIRTLAVEPVLVGSPEEDFMVERTVLEPGSVRVRGPSTALANLTSVDTKPIHVRDMRHDTRIETALELPRGVEVVGTDTIEARIDIEAKVDSRMFPQVPIFVRDQPGWRVEPATVRVQLEGPAAALRKIRDRDLVGQIFLPDAPQRSDYSVRFDDDDPVHAEIPIVADGVEVVSVNPEQIQVRRP